MLRANSVIAGGPPMVCRSRFPGGVVADLQGRLTQFVQRHLAACPGLSPWRVRDDLCRIDEDLLIERQLAALRLLQDRGRGVRLERRTHREQLRCRGGRRAPGLDIDGVDADDGVVPTLQRRRCVRRFLRADPPVLPVRVWAPAATAASVNPPNSAWRRDSRVIGSRLGDQPAMLRSGCGRDFLDRCGPSTAAP